MQQNKMKNSQVSLVLHFRYASRRINHLLLTMFKDKPCLWVLAAAFLWGTLSTYWYMCIIKGLCSNTAPVQQIVTEQQPITPQSTWEGMERDPLIVYFGINNDDVLTDDVEPRLRAIVAYMQTHPSAQIAITGHTNVHRDDAYTVRLGKERAEKVKELLVSYGASPASIITFSRGQYVLAAPATTPENQALNRRAVISVISN